MTSGKPTNAGAPLLAYPRLRGEDGALSIETYVVLNTRPASSKVPA